MIRLSKSIVGVEEAQAVAKVITEDGYLGMGKEVALFESELASFLGVNADHISCVNTGTSAIHLALEAVLESGDEVLVPSLTYLASYQAISASGAVPISCDVSADTLTIDLNDAEQRITSRTRAIMPVHYASNPTGIDEIYSFARKYNLRVVEDAAHAFGCKYKDQLIGSFGDIVCFSFDGIKNITSGEGGAVYTTDQEVAQRIKDARLLGVEKDTEKRFSGQRSWEFDVTRQGYRYHMSNLFAAIGRVQLRRLMTEFAPKRRSRADLYRRLLRDNQFLKFQKIEEDTFVIPHILSVRVVGGMRDGLKSELEKQGVQTGLHYKPNHLLSLYKTEYSLPISEQLYKEMLSLPLHPEIEENDVYKICEIINSYLIQ